MAVAPVKWLETALEITGGFESSGDPWVGLSGNFDDMGVSLGILQWNFGMGSLQSLVNLTTKDVVMKYMPKHGKEFWETCQLGESAAVRESLHWQSHNNIEKSWADEMRTFLGSQEGHAIQLKKCEDLSTRAYKLAMEWDGTNPVTLKSYCYFFDIYTHNGGMKGIWKQNVEDFKKKHGGKEQALAEVCKWLANVPKSKYGYADAKKNSAIWSKDQGSADMILLSYLRCLLSKTIFQADTMNRKGSIAATRGYVHGDLFNFTKLREVKNA